MTYKPNHDAPLHQTRHRNSAIQAASGLYDVIDTIVYDGYGREVTIELEGHPLHGGL
jgi:hypothetical protein